VEATNKGNISCVVIEMSAIWTPCKGSYSQILTDTNIVFMKIISS